jgi:hypothetical protein
MSTKLAGDPLFSANNCRSPQARERIRVQGWPLYSFGVPWLLARTRSVWTRGAELTRNGKTAAHCRNGEVRPPLWVIARMDYCLAILHSAGMGIRLHRSRAARSRLACGALLLAGAWLVATHAGYAQQSPTEYQVKAAYLFNFLKFVEWPEDPPADARGKWVIGVVGENPFGDELTQAISGKSVQGHELQVRRFQPTEDLSACHILFISASEKKRLPSILTALGGSSVLTVGDMENFSGSGGMIQFVMEGGSIRFAINVAATSRARLKVSSKLLSLARVVTGTERSATN